MFQIVYMKADFEPWWKFEGWEKNIITTSEYDSAEEFEVALKEMLEKFRSQYPNEKVKENKYYAFWTEDEQVYCEACDDTSQIYHGILIEKE